MEDSTTSEFWNNFNVTKWKLGGLHLQCSKVFIMPKLLIFLLVLPFHSLQLHKSQQDIVATNYMSCSKNPPLILISKKERLMRHLFADSVMCQNLEFDLPWWKAVHIMQRTAEVNFGSMPIILLDFVPILRLQYRRQLGSGWWWKRGGGQKVR